MSVLWHVQSLTMERTEDRYASPRGETQDRVPDGVRDTDSYRLRRTAESTAPDACDLLRLKYPACRRLARRRESAPPFPGFRIYSRPEDDNGGMPPSS